MADCLICKNPIEPFIDFGRMPIANGFLSRERFEDEYFFQLRVAFCAACTTAQLVDLIAPERMFHGEYAFFSSTSSRMASHFERLAEHVRESWLADRDPFVVEIGSNDGILLRHFAAARIRHLGVEPSANVAGVAEERGVRTVRRFFDSRLAREIVAEHGQADACLAANALCHIADLHSVAEGIRILLKPAGVLIFEDPYLGDIVEKTAYDQIYDEHAFYFSVSSVGRIFARHDLEIVDVAHQDVHGGSMRYVVARRGATQASQKVSAQLAHEDSLGLHLPETYQRLRGNIEASKEKLVDLLRSLRASGKRIVGYAATSKSATVTNYCGITPDLVEFISDTTPMKQGKYSPGMHIPVKSHDEFARAYPDYALLFGWNHAQEIFAKEEGFRRAGGKWILYVPEVRIVE